jgi:hypothetical protein
MPETTVKGSALKLLRHILHAGQRFVASARAGSFVGRFRRRARFAARAIDQDGILLLMPREPSLAFYWVPLAIVFTTGGAMLGLLS